MITSIRQHRSGSAGFTLIEIMVAMLVLAGGLLGVAYLQTWSIKFGQESFNRTQIFNLGNNLIDRMRAMQVLPGSADAALYSATSLGTCDPLVSSVSSNVSCFYGDLTGVDPNATASFTEIDADSDTVNESYLVTIFWSDRGLASQADLSRDDYDTLSDKSLDTKAKCNAVAGRAWSEDLDYPAGNKPATGVCMTSYSWTVQLYAPSTINTANTGTASAVVSTGS